MLTSTAKLPFVFMYDCFNLIREEEHDLHVPLELLLARGHCYSIRRLLRKSSTWGGLTLSCCSSLADSIVADSGGVAGASRDPVD